MSKTKSVERTTFFVSYDKNVKLRTLHPSSSLILQTARHLHYSTSQPEYLGPSVILGNNLGTKQLIDIDTQMNKWMKKHQTRPMKLQASLYPDVWLVIFMWSRPAIGRDRSFVMHSESKAVGPAGGPRDSHRHDDYDYHCHNKYNSNTLQMSLINGHRLHRAP